MKHLFIPDAQVRPGVPLDHLEALSNFILDKKPDILINGGDWWDMPSLNSYEKKGSKYFEGVRYKDDVDSGKEAMHILLDPIKKYNDRQKKNKKKAYEPRMVYIAGNHCQARIERAIKEDPRLEGTISVDDLEIKKFGWEFVPFLHPIEIDGIAYCHYFINPDSPVGSPLGGGIENKLKLIGTSFTQGHTQKRQYGIRYNGLGKEIHGLVAGAFYMHSENYLNPQGNASHWRGVVLKHEVKDGKYDPMFVSLEYLLRKWL